MTNETETRPTLWGIWHMENGKATLCESDESMSVYCDCAFQNEANARAYAETLNARWNNNAATHGWVGNACYFAAPLPEGCKAEWIDGEESEYVDLCTVETHDTAPRRAFVFVRDYGDATQCRDLCDLINATTLYHAYLNDSGTPVIPCRIPELGDFLSRMAENPQTSWIEFSVSFEF